MSGFCGGYLFCALRRVFSSASLFVLVLDGFGSVDWTDGDVGSLRLLLFWASVCVNASSSLGSDRRAGPSVLLFSCGGMSYTQLRSAPDAPDALNTREKTPSEPHRGVIARLKLNVTFLDQMLSRATVCKDIINPLLVWHARFVGVIDVQLWNGRILLCFMKHTFTYFLVFLVRTFFVTGNVLL